MKKMKQLCASVLLIGSMGTLFGAAGRDQTISPQTYCTGYITGSCNITIAPAEVGDVVDFDTAGAKKEALGDISAEKSGTIAVPAVNKKQLVSFTPQGDTPFKGKEIELLFASFDVNKLPADSSKTLKEALERTVARLRKEMGDELKTMVLTYRKLPGETKWTEFGGTGLPMADPSQADPLNYTITPNGQFTIKAQAQVKGKVETFTWKADLGKIG